MESATSMGVDQHPAWFGRCELGFAAHGAVMSSPMGRRSKLAFWVFLLIVALAFRSGWFVSSAYEFTKSVLAQVRSDVPSRSNVISTDWNSAFAKSYKEAKAKAIARQATPLWYAGEYVKYLVEGMGDTHSETILITSSHEYFEEFKSCMTNGPENFGTVRALGEGRLELCPRTRDQPGSDHCTVMCAIPWGQRQYLVWEGKLHSFVDAIDQGMEPCKDGAGNFLMRKGDWEKPVEGKPKTPKVD